MPRALRFPSHGVHCAAWHLPAGSDTLTSDAGRPCIVMAHGFGGTRDSGLLGYAKSFATAGMDALVFDYRGFGSSEGTPRQDVSVRRQRQDYHAAIAAARSLPGVDPDRVAVWGTSYSGGHAIAVAAQDPRIAGVVALTPATDGLSTLAHLYRHAGIVYLLRATVHGLIDVACAVAGRAPHYVPVAGEPGSSAIIALAGAEQACRSMAGPTWRNEVAARAALRVAWNRPAIYARRLACPLLLQPGTLDRVAPARAAHRVAHKAGHWAQVRQYAVDHLDVYAGSLQQQAACDQVEFLTRVLSSAPA